MRIQHHALLLALQDLVAAVGGPDDTWTSTMDLAQARRAADDTIEINCPG